MPFTPETETRELEQVPRHSQKLIDQSIQSHSTVLFGITDDIMNTPFFEVQKTCSYLGEHEG